jgi:hypothetical protein
VSMAFRLYFACVAALMLACSFIPVGVLGVGVLRNTFLLSLRKGDIAGSPSVPCISTYS